MVRHTLLSHLSKDFVKKGVELYHFYSAPSCLKMPKNHSQSDKLKGLCHGFLFGRKHKNNGTFLLKIAMLALL